MKVIVAGSRQVLDSNVVFQAIQDSGFHISELVSGACKGVDETGEDYANAKNIPIVRFKPDWTKHGRAAGPIRNRAMAAYADALVAIWDGQSRGTANMIEEAKERNLKIFIMILGDT